MRIEIRWLTLSSRHPFLDHRVVDFAISLPADLQFESGWTENLLRQSFPELPDEVRWRKDKQGFTTPEELWLKRQLAGLIEHVFQNSLLDEFGLFDSRALLKQYTSFCNGSPLVSFGNITGLLLRNSGLDNSGDRFLRHGVSRHAIWPQTLFQKL